MKYEMTKEQLIKALEICSETLWLSNGPRKHRDKEEYTIYEVPWEISDKVPEEGKRRDFSCLVIDLKNERFTYLSNDESYHNGSAYNNYSFELEFADIYLLSDLLMKFLVTREKKILEDEEKNRKRMELEHRVWTRLQVS